MTAADLDRHADLHGIPPLHRKVHLRLPVPRVQGAAVTVQAADGGAARTSTGEARHGEKVYLGADPEASFVAICRRTV